MFDQTFQTPWIQECPGAGVKPGPTHSRLFGYSGASLNLATSCGEGVTWKRVELGVGGFMLGRRCGWRGIQLTQASVS